MAAERDLREFGRRAVSLPLDGVAADAAGLREDLLAVHGVSRRLLRRGPNRRGQPVRDRPGEERVRQLVDVRVRELEIGHRRVRIDGARILQPAPDPLASRLQGERLDGRRLGPERLLPRTKWHAKQLKRDMRARPRERRGAPDTASRCGSARSPLRCTRPASSAAQRPSPSREPPARTSRGPARRDTKCTRSARSRPACAPSSGAPGTARAPPASADRPRRDGTSCSGPRGCRSPAARFAGWRPDGSRTPGPPSGSSRVPPPGGRTGAGRTGTAEGRSSPARSRGRRERGDSRSRRGA